MFSGSYKQDDVCFLLKQINMTSTEIEDKERLIQKGKSHYSEMLTFEKPPTDEYMKIFYDTLNLNGQRFKNDTYLLANKINEDYINENEIVVISLARAGTPVGVLLKRILQESFERNVSHYCISIIRDKGIDYNAIKYILGKHKDTSIVFVDGWTGKGVIGQELYNSITLLNKQLNTSISSNLYVIADISATAYWASTHDDYLLPSAVLNSTVSGLISRTVLSPTYINEDDFHGCVYYDELVDYDISQWFIEEIMALPVTLNDIKVVDKKEIYQHSINTISHFLNYYGLNNRNYIKPGVGESTRVLLRRKPKEIWVKDKNMQEISHLLYLAEKKCVTINVDANLPYNAVAIIEEMD